MRADPSPETSMSHRTGTLAVAFCSRITQRMFAPLRGLRRLALPASLALAMGLVACGGGDFPLTIDVSVGGHVSGPPIGPGQRHTITLIAGQSIELDASEPVAWTLYVGGSAVTGSGTVVSYGGVDIALTTVSSSRIVVDTHAAFALAAPVLVTFTATSTIDSALVATVDVLIDN